MLSGREGRIKVRREGETALVALWSTFACALGEGRQMLFAVADGWLF